MFGHGQHLAIPDSVAEGAIGPWLMGQLEHGTKRLGFAGAAGNSDEAVGDDTILNCYFGGEDAIFWDAEVGHARTDDPLIGGGNGPDVASGGAQAVH